MKKSAKKVLEVRLISENIYDNNLLIIILLIFYLKIVHNLPNSLNYVSSKLYGTIMLVKIYIYIANDYTSASVHVDFVLGTYVSNW